MMTAVRASRGKLSRAPATPVAATRTDCRVTAEGLEPSFTSGRVPEAVAPATSAARRPGPSDPGLSTPNIVPIERYLKYISDVFPAQGLNLNFATSELCRIWCYGRAGGWAHCSNSAAQ